MIKFLVIVICLTFTRAPDNKVGFSNLITIFQECTITYLHLQPLADHHYELQEEDDMSVIDGLQSIFKKYKALLQFLITTKPGLASATRDQHNLKKSCHINKRLSLCKVLVLQGTDEILLDELAQNKAEFVWFLTFDLETNCLRDNFTHALVQLHVPRIYLKIANFCHAYLLDIPRQCSKLQAPHHFIDSVEAPLADFENIHHVRKRWSKLHSNMRGVHISMPLVRLHAKQIQYYYYNTGQNIPCGVYPKLLKYIDPNFCSMILLSDRLNFSFLFGNPGSFASANVHSVIRDRLHISKFNRQYWKNHNEVAVTYGVTLEYFSFIVLLDKEIFPLNKGKLKGILAPFPWWTWISTGSLGFTTSVILMRTMNNLQHRISTWRILHAWFSFSALLVDQPAKICLQIRLNKIMLWMAWASFCLVMSHAYRGFLFSSLATKTSPVVPETLNELVETRMLIGSTANYRRANGGSGPTLTEYILPETISPAMNQPARNFYNYLQTCVRWFTVSATQLTVQVSKNKSTDVNFHLYHFSDKFAIIDPLWMVDKIKILFEDVGVYWVSKPVTQPVLLNRQVWTATYNYFYLIFEEFLGKTYDSGMHARWGKFLSAHRIKSEKKIVRHLLGDSIAGDAITNFREHEVSKHIYVEILFHFCVFILLAVLFFIAELGQGFRRKYRLRLVVELRN